MSDVLTNVAGVELKSEFSDKVLYNTVRSLQFLFLHTYKFGSDLRIEESGRGGKFLYGIENAGLNLRGYVGRDKTGKEIAFAVIDKGRLCWLTSEGFELNQKTYSENNVLLRLNSMSDFILFLAGRGGWNIRQTKKNRRADK